MTKQVPLFEYAINGMWDGHGTHRVYWIGAADHSIAATYVARKPKIAQWIDSKFGLMWYDPAGVLVINSK